ncbi:protein big brother-like [Chironomus tepperi]|uniref:protein big brother-like n=1 Tax=Chironomus tepperi TaxID=113505 RepID=UPI00391F3A7F
MNMINEAVSFPGMLPFDTMGLYEPPRPRYILKMPRVVPDQKEKFESDDIFKKLSRDGEVRFTGFRDRPQEERKIRFQNGCREGHTEISFFSTGINIQLMFNPNPMMYHHHHHHHHHLMNFERELDFDKEHGKVHIKSHFIMNGVCVRFRGWIDLERLDGIGKLEFDERRAAHEDAILKEQLERYSQRLKDFEDTKPRNTNLNDNRNGNWRQ